MLDLAQAEGIYVSNDSSSDVALRRVRLGINGDLDKRMSAEFSFDIDVEDSAVSLHEATLEYQWAKSLALQAGFFKQPFGLEGSTSSKHLRTLERSMASDAFVPERGVGVALSIEKTAHYLSIGAYRDREVEDVQYITARAVWSPMESKRNVLHLGASVSQRDNAGTEYRVSNSGNIATGENFLKSARFYPESITTLGVEGAWSKGSLLVQAEWFWQSLALSDTSGNAEPEFSGGYVQAGWIFDHGYRKYDGRRFGKIAGTKSRRALEFVAGIGTVDVRHAGLSDQAREATLGLNYQLTKTLSLGGQVQSVTALDNNVSLRSGEGVQFRMVAAF